MQHGKKCLVTRATHHVLRGACYRIKHDLPGFPVTVGFVNFPL